MTPENIAGAAVPLFLVAALVGAVAMYVWTRADHMAAAAFAMRERDRWKCAAERLAARRTPGLLGCPLSIYDWASCPRPTCGCWHPNETHGCWLRWSLED